MKIAISIPDSLFESAKRRAKSMGVSRSEFYRLALSAYLKKHDRQAIEDAVNAVCDADPSAENLEPALKRAQYASLAREEWQEV